MKTLHALKLEFRRIAHERLPYHWLEGLLLSVIDKPKSFLITNDEYRLSDDEFAKLQDGITQMQKGVPLAYVIGEAHFYGRAFAVNAHTLIPRPDTEILVEAALDFAKNAAKNNAKNHAKNSPDDKLRILDLGTGSGCIAITLAKELPDSDVLAVDFSDEALQIARQNALGLGAINCEFMQSSWYQSLTYDTPKFHIIVSNPPYIADDDVHLADLKAEPITALVANDNGLADIKIIITGAKNHLHAGGLLAIEHGYNQGAAVRALFAAAGFSGIATVKDYGDNERVTLGVWQE
ncbi:protein-(glutamine-N5) methyltransferase, release factor-specific [Moraxella caviae]|uniref:Release factor glutamine methyltransferase n=1 Tax=Moraxella caviae TaxID=34060 RepID=A0A1T0A734_9GAMM|nr:peptide chain release factor N(5)-glutamine methyltransferase [Moraxella caviae]OOR91554.1 protein-(glutamine-N5) methyltransferase, release factor-specific [Moraxella caviae]STZ14359.1 Release factor glutamine methyltransferase [Moraxella caviae]